MKLYTETVSFDLAVKLKKKGYDKPAFAGYTVKGEHKFSGETRHYYSNSDEYVSAPTYGEVLDWLLEKGYFLETTLLPSVYPPQGRYCFELKPTSDTCSNVKHVTMGGIDALTVTIDGVLNEI